MRRISLLLMITILSACATRVAPELAKLSPPEVLMKAPEPLATIKTWPEEK